MLKRLELVGFKSFADKTHFDFAPGITAVVGPNGSGKCVSGDTLVTLADGRDVPIQELVESALDGSRQVEALDDGVLTRENPAHIQVVTLNPRTLRLEHRPVTAFVKREAPAHLLRIRTRAGREVTATAYHPLFTLERGELRALRADELKVGVRVALPRALPVETREVGFPPFEVLKHFQPNDRIFVPNSNGLRTWANTGRTAFGTWKAWRSAAQVSEVHLRGFLEGQSVNAATLVRLADTVGRVPPLDGALKCLHTPLQIRMSPRLTPDLARFLGLLVAEGRSAGTNQLRFVNSDPALTETFGRLATDLFGVRVLSRHYKPEAADSLIFARALQVVLERLFHFPIESPSKEKQAPPQVFLANDAIRWAFLSGLFEGDAHVSVRHRPGRRRLAYIEYSTASPVLARQVVALLLRLGIFALLRSAEKWATNSPRRRLRTYYQVLIYGTEQLRRAANHLSFVGEKAQTLEVLRQLPSASNPNLDLIPGVTPLVKEALQEAGVAVKTNRKECPRLASYYEQRCEASRGGLLEVIDRIESHGRITPQARSQLERLRELARSDVYWDEIVSIEEVQTGDPWVYDLCVAETHNFVAGNIIVHNSNIVDAVRWILGEQSAKSLRGGEMADVIFNGSATRRSLPQAEVTMTFDNERRQLNTEAAEVQITRRVFRDGQGEYLINQHVSRLKDIKDLFLGSGAGSEACIIAQGRVESLLQSSTRDRRVIFEEAAGISRFKAKKTETLRKLERVDQNLQQLKAILDEVEKQLRQTRMQASKAQRFQEYSHRLQELRVALGLQEYHELSQRLHIAQEILDGLRSRLAESDGQRQTWEAEVSRLDAELARLDAGIHEQESKHGAARRHIAEDGARLKQQQDQTEHLENDIRQRRAGLTGLNARVAALTAQADAAAHERATVETQCAEQEQRVSSLEQTLKTLAQRIDELTQQARQDRAEHTEQTSRTAQRRNDVTKYTTQMNIQRAEHERHRQKATQATETISALELEIQALKEVDESLKAQLSASRQRWMELTQERDRLRAMSAAALSTAADLRAQRSGMLKSIEVLDALVRSHEGIGAGPREVLALLEQDDPGPWRCVVGMVADLLTVSREQAPLIDLALGERAQRFLVRDMDQLHEALRRRTQPFASRVGFLSAPDRAPVQEGANGTAPAGIPAADLVRCDHPEMADLPALLLHGTRIVADLETARACAAHAPGLRFITIHGELLEADGTLTVGTHHAETGILSRKSELRELRAQLAGLEARISDADGDALELRTRADGLGERIAGLEEEAGLLGRQVEDLRVSISEKKSERDKHQENRSENLDLMRLAERDIPELETKLHQAQTEAEETERQAHAARLRAEQAEKEVGERQQERERLNGERVTTVAEFSRVAEQLKGLRETHRQTAEDLAQRRQEQQRSAQQLATALARQQESQQIMLQATAALAVWYLEKESAERHLAGWAGEREERQQARQELAGRLQSSQNTWRTLLDDATERDKETSRLRLQIDTLAGRLREDYQLELAELYQKEPEAHRLPDDLTPEAAQKEIDELRRKKDKLGSVNLDALAELADLENRSHTLQAQYDDLTAAQRSLQDIINKINLDSRKLFAETFNTIREHFKVLFRKLFGGGQADVILEDENDVLECGIEIQAQPPGKELRSIALMSGGEKTMTAVALLLAIFRSKPSPFCLLDEVDAALDEANIGRFTACLRDFLDQTQFILVTHSKKSMACADVLYGVTMQESGISKRVAVRFEDWPDDGAPSNGEVQKTNEAGFAGR